MISQILINFSMGSSKNCKTGIGFSNNHKLVKNPKTVMLDLIGHTELIEITGFRRSTE
jgi:hypothetical protein